MAALQLPPSETTLKATGPVLVFKQPGPGEHWYFADDHFTVGNIDGQPQPVKPAQERDYQDGDPLGKSLGVPALGTDGETYLKIECFKWRVQKAALFFDDWSREYRIGYLRLVERDQNWIALTADGLPTGDVLDNLVTIFKANTLPGYLANGVPEPTDYSLGFDKAGQTRLYLTFKNGYKVIADDFDALSIAEKLAYTGDGKDDNTPAPGPGGTSYSVWAIIAGAGIFTLLGVVILVQIQRKKRRDRLQG